MTGEKTYLSQSVDYLGFLEAKLRDLRGIATLVHELLQNADDVRDEEGRPAATRITFDVCDDALIVENDGVFRQRDFSRMQRIAGGGKREEAGTTGAFGIGFISVYQITDHPEIFSTGRHWTLRPEAAETERIEQELIQTTATRFRLPWAFDPSSQVRQKLRIEAVKRESLDGYLHEMGQALSGAALFLKQLKVLELKRSGLLIRRIERGVDDQGAIWIDDAGKPRGWCVLRGSFASEERILRANFGQIEAKRHSDVLVAVPDDPSQAGRLYAVLPTQSQIPVPFYINADFFPSSDRKRILLEDGYQTDWNRAALRAAAQTMAEHFDHLRQDLGHAAFWNLIGRLNEARLLAKKGECDEVFGEFWRSIEGKLPVLPIVYTAAGRWLKPSEARLLESDAELAAEPILRALGIAAVHPDLRPYFSLMRQREIGTSLLSIPDIIVGLKSAGLIRATPASKAPPILRNRDNIQLLWSALDAVWARQSAAERQANRTPLSECAIALDSDNVLQPPAELYRADDEARAIFPFDWLHPDLPADHMPGMLVEEFDAAATVAHLEEEANNLREQWQAGQWHPERIYRWLEGRREKIVQSSDLVHRLRAVPMWPAAGHLYPLTELYIPGGFDDPLKLAVLVDIDALGGRKEFLEDLRVKPLTFETYVREQAPQVFRTNPDLPAESRRGLVQLLARKLGEIRGDEELRRVLGGLPLVECTDGEFRAARQTYAPSNVAAFLADRIHIAALAAQDAAAQKALYEWLGVAQEPRPEDVLARLRAMPATPDVASRQLVQSVFEYLVSQWPKWENDKKQPYAGLRTMDWLPGRDAPSRWYKPGLLHAVFQEYLYRTQAIFLDLPQPLQNQAGAVKLIEFLGINEKPTVQQVVNHLQKCSHDNVAVKEQVYRFLSDNLKDPTVANLKGAACLYLPPPHGYVHPQHVFWSEHSFGPYRHRLGPELRRYQPLFDMLGVREAPKDSDPDYLEVILEISEQFAPGNHPLEDAALGVLMHCWERLTQALEADLISTERLGELSQSKVIPDPRGVLTEPENLFFEDRAGLAGKFKGFLDNSVLVRPKGAWPAMAAAGVRLLSQAVKVNLLEPPTLQPDSFLGERIRERRLLIDRAIESVKTGDSTPLRPEALAGLRYECAECLQIEYAIDAFRRRVTSSPEMVPALLRPDEGLLLSVHCDGDVPWGAIARELASAIKPEGEPGALAAGIKEALANDTLEKAQRALDDLGYPPLQETVRFDATDTPVITAIGGGAEGGEQPAPGASPEGTGDGGDATPTAEQAVRDILGGVDTGRPPMPPGPNETAPGGDGFGSGVSGTGGGPGPAVTGAKRPARGKLRTYVLPPDDKPVGDAGRKRAEQNLSVDAIGVRRVLDYERSNGRTPVEMDHFHEGYDVESVDAAGEMRYIEVKSLSGIWTEHDAAGLTAAQFEKGRELGEQFWLYVVERAISDDDYRIICVQDPVRRVDQHLYDDGWRKLADESYEPALAG